LKQVGATCVVVPYAWWCGSPDYPVDRATADRIIRDCIDTMLAEVCSLVQRIDPDFVWTQSLVIPWGALVAALVGKPHVWSVCEYGERDHNFQFFFPFEKIVDDIVASSNLIYTCTDDVAETLFRKSNSKTIKTLYRHIEIPPNIGPAREIVRSRIRLGIFGTISVLKGQEDAILATAELVQKGHDVELVLAGHELPIYKKRLETLVHGRGLENRVSFLGVLPDPYPCILETDIVVICSRNEGFGRICVEAMLLGRAIVYPRVGGFAEYMIDGQTGFGYTPENVAQLVVQIEKLITDPNLRHSLGAHARQYATERFSRDQYGGKVYRTLLELKSSSSRVMSLPSTLTQPLNEMLKLHYLSRSKRDEYDRKIASLEQQLDVLKKQFQEINSAGIQKEIEADRLNAELQYIKGSTSYKIIRPARAFASGLRALGRFFGKR